MTTVRQPRISKKEGDRIAHLVLELVDRLAHPAGPGEPEPAVEGDEPAMPCPPELRYPAPPAAAPPHPRSVA